MTKREDQRIAALAKKNAAKAAVPKPSKAVQSDPTLRIRNEESKESRAVFNEMKKREF